MALFLLSNKIPHLDQQEINTSGTNQWPPRAHTGLLSLTSRTTRAFWIGLTRQHTTEEHFSPTSRSMSRASPSNCARKCGQGNELNIGQIVFKNYITICDKQHKMFSEQLSLVHSITATYGKEKKKADAAK
jgi:hypothetical protein